MGARETFPLEPYDLAIDGPEDEPDRALPRACRECGCTERDACYRPDLGACSWADRDLCSHCLPFVQQRGFARRLRVALLVALACLLTALVVIALLTEPRAALRGRLELTPSHIPIRPGVHGAPWAANA